MRVTETIKSAAQLTFLLFYYPAQILQNVHLITYQLVYSIDSYLGNVDYIGN